MTTTSLNNARLALYLNQAEHNAFMIIKEVFRKMDADKQNYVDGEIGLAKKFYKIAHGYYDKRLELQRMLELLQFYFPFMEMLAKDAPDPEKAQIEKLTLMLIVLNTFRNHYSHYTTHPSILHDGFLKRDFKKDKNGDPNADFHGVLLYDKEGKEKHFNGRNILFEVRKATNTLYKKAVEEKMRVEYFKHSDENRSTSKKDYKYIDKLNEIETIFLPLLKIEKRADGNENKEVPELSQLFKTTREDRKDTAGKVIRDEKTGKARPYFKIEKINSDGLLYFICLFLNSGDANRLISGTTGFKRNDDLVWESKRLAFRHFCCKPPHSRLRSISMTDDSLLLDIIGELQKCPAEIYPLLDDEYRQKFRFGTDVYLNNNEEKVENESLQKRYENRFPYLALRYLDSLNLPNLRFQLTLGKVNMKKYEKRFMDEIIDRQLQKEVKVFDRLCNYPYENDVDENGIITRQAVSKLIEESLKGTSLDKNSLLLNEWEEDGILSNNWQHFAPHYNFENNTIALSLMPHTFKHFCATAATNKFGLPHLKQPDAVLGIYELPQLVWFAMQNEKNPKKIESFIERTIDTYKKEFNTGIELKGKDNPELYKYDYPKPIYAILTNKRLKPLDKVKGITEALLAENSEIMERAEKWLQIAKEKAAASKISKGKTNKHTIIPKGKRGTIATWIAKDIIWLCPPEVRMHIGQAFANALQENLAIYSVEKLKGLFNYSGENTGRAWPRTIKAAHPFLYEKTGARDNLFDFYQEYITCRAAFFKEQADLALTGLNKTRFPDLLGISADIKSLANYLKPFKTDGQETLTVNLAKGGFNGEIAKIAAGRQANQNVSGQGAFSFNFMLAGLQPQTQEFYSYPRLYKRFENGEEQEGYIFTDLAAAKRTASKNLFKIINQTEKQIRQRQAEDRMLFLMTKQLSGKLFREDIFLDNNLGDFFNANVWEKRRLFEFSIAANLPRIRAEVRLKDAGSFTKFLADHRLKPLLAYYDLPAVDYMYQLPAGEEAKAERIKNNQYYFDKDYRPNIKDEVQFFEEVREVMFAEGLAFERYVLEWADQNGQLNNFNTFYAKNGYSNHRQDYLLPIAQVLIPGTIKEDFKTPEVLAHPPAQLLMLSIMTEIRNKTSHNEFFKRIWKQLFTDNILDIDAKRDEFIAFGEKSLESYYSVEEQNSRSVNLSAEAKVKRSLDTRERTAISIRFFKDFCEGRQTAFVAEWWLVAYRYMINKIKEELIIKSV